MTSLVIVLYSAMMLGSPSDAPTSPDRGAYEAAKEKGGRGAEANTKLALWCESHGLPAERMKHLALAVLADPKNALARGMMGMVAYEGLWKTPDQVGRSVSEDADLSAKLADYNARRAPLEKAEERDRASVEWYKDQGNVRAANDFRLRADRTAAEGHVRLGMWCESVGLKAEALAHFTTAVHLDPYRDSTWKHLGCVKHNGRWMRPEEAAAADKEARDQKVADHRWEPLLMKWKAALGDKAKRAEAEESLSKVTDPRAVPAIRRIFEHANAPSQFLEIELLGRIDSPLATKGLARLAVFGVEDAVRSAAIESLKGREARDYAGALVDMIHAPIEFAFKPVNGPGSRGTLEIDTPRFHLVRTYDAPAAFSLSSSFYGYVGIDPNGLPVVIRGADLRHIGSDLQSPKRWAEAEQILERAEAKTQTMFAEAAFNAESARQRMAADLREIQTTNAEAQSLNPKIAAVLTSTLDAPASLSADDEDGWRSWWNERLGYRYTPAPKVNLVQTELPQYPPYRIMSCFAAGTPVRTLHGSRPIESLRVGDRVLAQDATTGALGFEPILVVHRNPPDATLRISLGAGEPIVASRFHRFWQVGRGWCMAKDLKPGDVLRILEGTTRVSTIDPAPVQPVFNLDVANAHTFFVGPDAALVHDNTLPNPHLKPFDAIGIEKSARDSSPTPREESAGEQDREAERDRRRRSQPAGHRD